MLTYPNKPPKIEIASLPIRIFGKIEHSFVDGRGGTQKNDKAKGKGTMKTKIIIGRLLGWGYTRCAAMELLREGRRLGKTNAQIYDFSRALYAMDYAIFILGADHVSFIPR